jgi:hypothetical protein
LNPLPEIPPESPGLTTFGEIDKVAEGAPTVKVVPPDSPVLSVMLTT